MPDISMVEHSQHCSDAGVQCSGFSVRVALVLLSDKMACKYPQCCTMPIASQCHNCAVSSHLCALMDG